jgi:cell division protein ZapA (FtsZ GTPase activity inhibitor)
MKEIKESGRLMSLERIALQAALNFSDELLKLHRDLDVRKEKIDGRIRMLADQLDDALKA